MFRPLVTVLVPARNESAELLTPALACGAEGMGTAGDTEKKAGILNFALRNEYARYARDIKRLHGKCLVFTGTAALFRAGTLQDVMAARRRGFLPAGTGRGSVYETSVLTEDNELSFALLTLGCRIKSPAECTLLTEIMPSWRELGTQRLRWKRGTVENCVQSGWTAATRPYWGRQALSILGAAHNVDLLQHDYFCAHRGNGLHGQPFWIAVTRRLKWIRSRAGTGTAAPSRTVRFKSTSLKSTSATCAESSATRAGNHGSSA